MGLANTVYSLGKTAVNGSGLLKDLGNNAMNWIGLGNDPKFYSPKQKKENSAMVSAPIKEGTDLRNVKGLFRGNYYMSNGDFCWSENIFQNTTQFNVQVPKIQIFEYQPYQQTFLGQLVVLAKGGIVKEIISAVKGGTSKGGMSAKSAFKLGGKVFKNLMIREYSKAPGNMYFASNNNSSVGNPFAAALNMFIEGNFLYSYQIPLITDESKGFTVADTQGKFNVSMNGGGLLASMMRDTFPNSDEKAQQQVDGIWKNIPSTPKFTNTLLARGNITTTFYLINKTNDYTIKNYKFMQSFIAGTFQVQLPGGVLHSPNVYYVQIPGKRQCIWAQLSVKAEEIGKLRKNEYVSSKLKQEGYTGKNDNFPFKSMLWPQAWKLTVSICDFTPDSINTYIHYLQKGSCRTSLFENHQLDLIEKGINVYNNLTSQQ